jgi:chemotaxis response regulator CheB
MKKQIMPKRRVLLVCSQHLFGESLEAILRAAKDVELIGPWDLGEDVCRRIAEVQPDAVVVADENPQSDEMAYLTSTIIEQYPELSVIRAGLTENVVRVFSTHLLPARGTDLIETIRNLPVASEAANPSNERSE